MSKNEGWISLHRKILENPFCKDPHAFSLWVNLLLRANHSDTKVMVGNKLIPVKRGQFLTGRKSLSIQTGINESKIQRLLNLFEREQQIEQQTFTKYRLISIVNYTHYQNPNSKRTANEQQTNTDNNDNNVNKNIKVCLDYLNQVTGRKFTAPGDLKARLKNYTVDDVKDVIDYKYKEWKGKPQAKYLRPATLFQLSKFEGYLNDAKQEIPNHENTKKNEVGQNLSASERVSENAKQRIAEIDGMDLGDDGQNVRKQVDQQLRGSDRPGEDMGSIIEGDFQRKD